MQEKKYGLQIRAPKSQQLTRPAIRKPAGFNDDDDDDVEREISRQAAKNKSLKEVEEQHKKALEEDPSVFDYDNVYDDMKSKSVQPKVQDRQQRQSKYVQVLMEKAKKREREHEIIYERKLAKERSKDDHLYADKDKYLTNAYKRKLAEQQRALEEERLRQLREEKDDVTKKSDLSDFYFNLAKNVAFGAAEKSEAKKPETQEKESAAQRDVFKRPETYDKEPASTTGERERPSTSSTMASPPRSEGKSQQEASATAERSPEQAAKPASRTNTSEQEKTTPGEQPPNDQPKRDHHKKNEDAVAAAKERFLARKRAKVQ